MANITNTMNTLFIGTGTTRFKYEDVFPIRYAETGWFIRAFSKNKYVKFCYVDGEKYNRYLDMYEAYNRSMKNLAYFENEQDYIEDQFIEKMKGNDVQLGYAHDPTPLKK